MQLEAQKKWMNLAKAEETFFCQRSRVLWLRDGDSCTAYFYKMTETRKVINHIHYLIALMVLGLTLNQKSLKIVWSISLRFWTVFKVLRC